MVKTYLYDEIQNEYSKKTKNILNDILGIHNPTAYVKTYGCQQNVSDSEKYTGMLIEMGFNISDSYEDADLILFNTCAIRENAENKVFGNIGRLKHIKKTKPNTIIILCGCMTQQPSIIDKIKSTYSFIDVVFGTHSAHEFPKIIYDVIQNKTSKKNKPIYIESNEDFIFEGAPTKRDNKIKAFVSIMSGCNNFCSYCIVPYVRGRERSRTPEAIVNEVENLLKAGYKDITLLGQNVNSYGKDLDIEINFSELLRKLDSFDNYDYTLRFMTSHPKDLSDELIATMASYRNICKAVHLPAQSGSNAQLEKMNRKYTREWYLERMHAIRKAMPECAITTDLISGFCSETLEDHEATLSLMREVGYASAFMFKYSVRPDTFSARHFEDDVPDEEKTRRLNEVIALQNTLSLEHNRRDVGKSFEVLIEGRSKRSDEQLCGRTSQNKMVVFDRVDGLKAGDYVEVEITDCSSATLFGRAKN